MFASLNLKHVIASMSVMGLLCCPVYAADYTAPVPIKTQISLIDQLTNDGHYHDALIKCNEALTHLAIGDYTHEELLRWTDLVNSKVVVIGKLVDVGTRG